MLAWKPELSIFVTRDMRTVPLYTEVPCEDGLEGVTGKISLGMYEVQELPEINPLGKLVSRGWQLEALFEEANGSIILHMLATEDHEPDHEHAGEVEKAPGSSILEYLDALVPRAH